MSEFPLVKYKDPNGEWVSQFWAFNECTGRIRQGFTAHRFTGEVDVDKVPWYEGDEGLSEYGGRFKVVLDRGRFMARFVSGAEQPLYQKDLATHTPPAKKYTRHCNNDTGPTTYESEDERVSDRRDGTKRPERKTWRKRMSGIVDETHSWFTNGKPTGRRSGPEERRTTTRRKGEQG